MFNSAIQASDSGIQFRNYENANGTLNGRRITQEIEPDNQILKVACLFFAMLALSSVAVGFSMEDGLGVAIIGAGIFGAISIATSGSLKREL